MDCFQNFSVLSWNIRGASSRNARRNVRDLIMLHHPSLFCIFETHVLFIKVEKFWLSLGYKPMFIHEAHGHAGAIWILSRTDNSDFCLIDSINQAITFSIKRKDTKWHCSSIYAPPTYTKHCHLWEYLRNLRKSIGGPWILVGGFNEILLSTEVSGGNFSPSRALLFGQFLTDCNLLDLHTIGGIYTWHRNTQLGGHIRKRLDRCVVDVDWQLLFPHAPGGSPPSP